MLGEVRLCAARRKNSLFAYAPAIEIFGMVEMLVSAWAR
jgi:hypothetical protein